MKKLNENKTKTIVFLIIFAVLGTTLSGCITPVEPEEPEEPEQYVLTTSVSPALGGYITLNPPGGVYNEGTSVVVTAAPNNGWSFVGWSGSTTIVSPSFVTVIDKALTFTANFEQIVTTAENFNTYTLYDPSNNIDVSQNSLSFSIPRNGGSYIKKDIAIGTGDFTLSFDVLITELVQNPTSSYVGAMVCLIFANQETTNTIQSSSTNVDGLRVTLRAYNNPAFPNLLRFESKDTDGRTEYSFALNTPYTVTVSRTGSTARMVVEQGSSVVHTGSFTDNTDINYFVALGGREDSYASGSTMIASGTLSNYVFS